MTHTLIIRKSTTSVLLLFGYIKQKRGCEPCSLFPETDMYVCMSESELRVVEFNNKVLTFSLADTIPLFVVCTIFEANLMD